MDRAEATGLGVAVAGHAALIAALVLGLAVTRKQTERTEAMEVSFVEEPALVSSAPQAAEEPAPSVGEEIGAPEEAAGAEASVPEPIAPPVPEPVRPPVETAERRRPDNTRNAVPIRPAPTPAPTPAPKPAPRPAPTPAPRPKPSPRTAEAQPRQRPPATPPRARPQPAPRSARPQARPQQQPSRPSARPQAAPRGQGRQQRSSGFDAGRLAESLGRGPPEAKGKAPNPPAQLSGAERQQLARNISGLIQPCAARATPPNGFAKSISVDLRVTVNQSGTPVSHQLVGSSGTNDSNESYVGDVVDVAMRAVRACSSRIASLPDDHYDIPGGWRTFRYRFRFP